MSIRPALLAQEKNKILFFAFLVSELRTPKFAKKDLQKSKSRFDQLNLEQNGPKKKILTSKVARNSKKYTQMYLELCSKFYKKKSGNKNILKKGQTKKKDKKKYEKETKKI